MREQDLGSREVLDALGSVNRAVVAVFVGFRWEGPFQSDFAWDFGRHDSSHVSCVEACPKMEAIGRTVHEHGLMDRHLADGAVG
jgi:hypothetical protein